MPGFMVPTTRLIPELARLEPVRARLLDSYIDYCTTVSKRTMAMSIETATYLWWICRQSDAADVLDMGSGFSSFVLRDYASVSKHDVRVTSVDDDALWLCRTGEFLRKWHETDDGLVLWLDWLERRDVRYDVIFHDFSRGEARNASMYVAAERLTPGGMLIFDDAQHGEHQAEMRKVAEKWGLDLISLRDVTVDAVRRYAAMAR